MPVVAVWWCNCWSGLAYFHSGSAGLWTNIQTQRLSVKHQNFSDLKYIFLNGLHLRVAVCPGVGPRPVRPHPRQETATRHQARCALHDGLYPSVWMAACSPVAPVRLPTHLIGQVTFSCGRASWLELWPRCIQEFLRKSESLVVFFLKQQQQNMKRSTSSKWRLRFLSVGSAESDFTDVNWHKRFVLSWNCSTKDQGTGQALTKVGSGINVVICYKNMLNIKPDLDVFKTDILYVGHYDPTQAGSQLTLHLRGEMRG